MSVVYLYGFVPPDAPLPSGGLLGVGDAAVELVGLDGFAAVVGRLEDPAYEGASLEAKSGDVEWMAEQGLRHEQVVAWFVDHGTIVPSRLLTLFSSEAKLRQATVPDADRIRDELERFAGVREWDLKVAYDRARLAEHLGQVSEEIGRLDRQIAEASPGKRFLLERKRQDLARSESGRAARRLAAELLGVLRLHARDVSQLPPPSDAAPVVVNAALLVAREREPGLLEDAAAERARLEPLGLSVQLTGPWAAYRFLEVRDDG